MTAHLSAKYKSSPRKLTSDGTTNGDHYFRVDGCQVTIRKGDDGEPYLEIQAQSFYSNSGDPKKHFPSMTVEQGQVHISIEDFVPLILERMEPIEVAIGLCQNSDIREEVVDQLASLWSSDTFTDDDRRRLLRGIKERLHTCRINVLARHMQGIEYEMSKLAQHHQQMIAFNHVLDVYGARRPDGSKVEFDVPPLPIDVAISLSKGTWAEARDYWRQRVEEMFQFIPDPEPETAETEVL